MKVAVIIVFSVDPLNDTVLEPYGAMVLFNTGMYFEGVWLRLRTRDSGMSLSSSFFDDVMQIGFFELFFEKVRNGNFSCSSKPPDKTHPRKKALHPA